ncbi:MAG TPA: FtsX-like permease family protein [Allosphingosinicella sp.]
MRGGARKMGAADRRLLPEGRLAGPMPWVIAIMMLLTVLAAAAGLRLASAAGGLDAGIGNRMTIQIVQPNPDLREREVQAALGALRRVPGVIDIRRIPPDELEKMLEPWLGAGGLEADLPVPAMIDVEMTPEAFAQRGRLEAELGRASPSARIDSNAQWLAPLAKLISALKWLAAGLVLLMIVASGATVVLAARASLDMHRSTIEVLHLMGATDLQVARLFQRRIALDALFGGIVGLVGAGAILAVIGDRVGALGSDLLGSEGLGLGSWLLLVALPVGGVVLAMLVARSTILRALGRML